MPTAVDPNHAHARAAATARKNDRPAPAPLNLVESEVIGLFVQVAHVIGLPRSVGEIYGLLFISAKPLALDDIIARLAISKGSASQGLKLLREAGAIHMAYVPTDRRTHYEAVAELKLLVTRFLRDKMIPQLDTGLARLDRISGLLKDLPASERARVAGRVTMLQSWQKKSRRFLPLVIKLMGG